MTKTILTTSVLLCSLFAFAQTVNANKVLPDKIKTTSIEVEDSLSDFMNVFVALEKELIVIQIKNLNTQDLEVTLLDSVNKEIKKAMNIRQAPLHILKHKPFTGVIM